MVKSIAFILSISFWKCNGICLSNYCSIIAIIAKQKAKGFIVLAATDFLVFTLLEDRNIKPLVEDSKYCVYIFTTRKLQLSFLVTARQITIYPLQKLNWF